MPRNHFASTLQLWIAGLTVFSFFALPFAALQSRKSIRAVAFAYIYQPENRDSTAKSAERAVPPYKYEVALRVFNALVQAKGNLSMQRPALLMTRSEAFVAWMDPDRVAIGLEEKAYDICVSFGPDSLNALAAILAHELTHYYEKHDWKSPYRAASTQWQMASGASMADPRHEAEADYLGIFLAFAAGFNPSGILPEFLTRVYQAYNLSANLEGYPSLEDRISLSRESTEKARNLVYIFETAGYLVALKKHAEAALYYQNILKEFQGREIYNNAGVNLLLDALTYFQDAELRFAYPVELDPETRIAAVEIFGKFLKGQRCATRLEIAAREKLLNEAIRLFDQAAALDQDYAPTLLNKAVACELLGQHRQARFWAEEANLLAGALRQKQAEADALTLLGIIAANQGEKRSALEYFQSAAAAGSEPAAINQKILNGETFEKGFTSRYFQHWVMAIPDPHRITERIDGVDLNKFPAQLTLDKLTEIHNDPDRRLKAVWGIKKYDFSRLLATTYEEGISQPNPATTLIHRTAADYPGQTEKGIRIGDLKTQIMEKYGDPERAIRLPEGELLIYYSADLIFRLDADGRVLGWGVFLEDG